MIRILVSRKAGSEDRIAEDRVLRSLPQLDAFIRRVFESSVGVLSHGNSLTDRGRHDDLPCQQENRADQQKLSVLDQPEEEDACQYRKVRSTGERVHGRKYSHAN